MTIFLYFLFHTVFETPCVLYIYGTPQSGWRRTPRSAPPVTSGHHIQEQSWPAAPLGSCLETQHLAECPRPPESESGFSFSAFHFEVCVDAERSHSPLTQFPATLTSCLGLFQITARKSMRLLNSDFTRLAFPLFPSSFLSFVCVFSTPAVKVQDIHPNDPLCHPVTVTATSHPPTSQPLEDLPFSQVPWRLRCQSHTRRVIPSSIFFFFKSFDLLERF